MGSALETLCGQAFGAGKVYMLGVYMQRSWLILGVSCVVISPIYIFATPILKLVGEEDTVADLAGKFAILTIPQLFSLAINFPSQKFLQAQSKVYVLACMGLMALISQTLMLWIFIDVLEWGIFSAAVAFDVSNWGLAIAEVVYIIFWCKEGWHGFSWSAFKDLWAFVRLSLASAVMLCLEVWYFMSITILAGHLTNAVSSIDALSICMNINGYEAMVFIGLNAAISKSLQREVSKLAYLLGITMILNSVQPVISGVAIGAGWQGLVAYINLGCYYIFGVPLGYVLGFVANWGVEGLWGGMICGTALQTLLLLIVLYKTNWSKEVEQTNERMRKWGGQEIVLNEDTNSCNDSMSI
ncbi:hypothetical protein ACFE04_009487 [Oxalis oulophora]